MKNAGLHQHRFRDNPEEQRIAKAWGRLNDLGSNLDYLLDDRADRLGPPPPCSPRDRVIAATIIQWLGSPVGQGFLRSLGYERRSER